VRGDRGLRDWRVAYDVRTRLALAVFPAAPHMIYGDARSDDRLSRGAHFEPRSAGSNAMPYSNGANRLEGHPLTAREVEVLALLADGKSTSDIAAQLGITPATIKSHLTSVYRKIGARNRVQAARHYLDHVALPPRK
jgi:DNA-binding CsgD family transcriptional regulator